MSERAHGVPRRVVRLPRLSVRTRAALAAVLALAPLTTAAAVAGVLVQRHELRQATSLVAEEQARSVANSLRDVRAGTLSGTLGGEETLVQVVGPSGVLNASLGLSGREPLVETPPPGGVTRTQVAALVAGEEDTYLVVATGVPGSDTYVVAARSLESAEAATSSTTRLFLIGVPVLVVLVGLLSWVLAGRALAPVEHLRRRASEITSTGTGVRLPEVATGDEIERLAATLNEMLERLDASTRAQRQFVADASHELRSPVASIRAVMEVSATTATDPAELRADVLAETERLAHLVDGLLALARRDATRPDRTAAPADEVDLSELVTEAAARPRRVPVDVHADGACVVKADARALSTLLVNLLDNAERHATTAVAVSLVRDRSTGDVELAVTDDGSGVPPADRERIFDRFTRLDEARTRDAGGAGLGLAIARATAEDLGGTLVCEQPQGRTGAAGARFVLTLPVVRAEGVTGGRR